MKELSLPINEDQRGKLMFIEGSAQIPFAIKRIFFINGKNNSERGDHAHYKCSQFLICLNGEVKVICDDGLKKTQHTLNNFNKGLLIKPMVWAKQTYFGENCILAVICDKLYDPNDYIHSYDIFKRVI